MSARSGRVIPRYRVSREFSRGLNNNSLNNSYMRALFVKLCLPTMNRYNVAIHVQCPSHIIIDWSGISQCCDRTHRFVWFNYIYIINKHIDLNKTVSRLFSNFAHEKCVSDSTLVIGSETLYYKKQKWKNPKWKTSTCAPEI